VVIASASQFHATPAPGFLGEVDGQEQLIEPAKNLVGPYNGLITQRLKHELGEGAFAQLSETEKERRMKAIPEADKKMAAMLVKRDAFNLADTLAPLTGRVFAQYIFGFGVIGMAMSAATMLMTINGLCFCELLGRPPRGWTQRIGALMVSVGALGPFFWNKAAFWLAVPTSVFAMVLLPIAYLAFSFLMNQKSLLGENMPRGGKRVAWNVLMVLAVVISGLASAWCLFSRTKKWFGSGWYGIGIVAAFLALVLVVHFARKNKATA